MNIKHKIMVEYSSCFETYAFILDTFEVDFSFVLKSSTQCISNYLQLFRQVLTMVIIFIGYVWSKTCLVLDQTCLENVSGSQ
jgi:hypothetical protein